MDTKTNLNGIPRHIVLLVAILAFVTPAQIRSSGNPFEESEPFRQEFIITAYYSPEPGQCCYIKGGLEADRILNGEGEISADGTSVFPGMIAAPPSYPFGSRIRLPGYGVFEVHDRGGAIRELGNDVHRLDIWVGHGEEGLARALSFGVQRMTGVVFPGGAIMPPANFDFDDIPVFFDRLEPYMAPDGNFLSVNPGRGDSGPSVRRLQQNLSALGYFMRGETDYFGEQTEQALKHFVRDFKLNEPSDRLTGITAAHMLSALVRKAAKEPVKGFIDRNSAPSAIMEAQRVLRFLGYYSGKTDGQYSDALFDAILKFQQDNWLVGTESDPGAGRIGPITLKRLMGEWNRALVIDRAGELLDRKRIEELLARRGEVIERYLGEGEGWAQVRNLQERLSAEGLFPPERITGFFGPVTKEAVIEYQLSRGLIESPDDDGAGYVGPRTLDKMKAEKVREVLKRVRGEGWGVI